MSKSFWIQVLSAAVIVINSLSGSMIPAEFLALGLAACNLILFIIKDKKVDQLKTDISFYKNPRTLKDLQESIRIQKILEGRK